MSTAFPPAQVIKDALAAAAKYRPESMWEFFEHLGVTPEMSDDFGRLFKILGDLAASELPTEPAVANLLYSMQTVCARVAASAAELKPAAERAHARELELRGHPNGKLWNV